MYAVIKAGGKQQKVQAGDVIEVEAMHGGGDTITFHPLLVVDDEGKTHFGKEAAKAIVTAKPVGEKKGDKIKVFKYKNKTGYARKAGHRQLMTLLEISDVRLGAPARTSARSKKADTGERPAAEAEAPPAETAEGEAEPEPATE